ncbi:MAG TPA: hypothetical protein VKB58_01695 [Terriglobales bacterium]|jgi:hypothetical protein|nr:hypothetical protein [Terriglobales bacterium]
MRQNGSLVMAFKNLSKGKLVLILVCMVGSAMVLFAQMGGSDMGAELQQKLAALKESAAQNKQKLRQYQWIETSQITLKGEQKPEQVYQCSYGPNGQVQKIPMNPQQPEQQGRGGLRGRIVEKKKAEMKDYMQQVHSLLTMYVPPNPQLMQQAFQKHNVSLDKSMGSSGVQLIFKSYAKEGDQMTITFDPATKKISTINVNTYMDDPKDAVTLSIQMASLPDGTNYAQQTMLNATAKQIQVTTTNSNYVKLSS